MDQTIIQVITIVSTVAGATWLLRAKLSELDTTIALVLHRLVALEAKTASAAIPPPARRRKR